ncbi:MAG: NHL repeat-containing protein [Clostridia bacterium]|nr:NHL repeat-containing protein [Clostridia bacterium]
MKRLACLMVLLCFLPSLAIGANDGYETTYSYTYDFWDEVQYSPDPYRVSDVIYSVTLGLDTAMRKPQSLFVQGKRIYVADTGNNRILEIEKQGEEYVLLRVIDHISGAQPETFSSPTDMFVDPEGNLYVADRDNNRVLMADSEGNLIREYVKPVDSTFDQSMAFLPNKIVVDSIGRVYVLATNVNKGLVKYEPDGTFTGYIGANPVKYNLWDYIWKEFLTTKEQRAQQASFVPTEYENIYIDHEGFIYCTNIVFSEYDLRSDTAKPIRRINAIGNDILIKNGWEPPIGDLQWLEGSQDYGPSKFKDITVFDDDIYVAFDRTHGRVFGYDPQGSLLWAFGTKGNSEGAFLGAVSIEHMDHDLLCLDENENSITVFTPTDYGSLIYRANDEYLRGEYETSADTWREVLKLNANYPLGFVGIGRALMRQNDFSGAMSYFKMAHDRQNYGRAYRYYRKDVVEKYIGWGVAVIAALLIVPLIFRKRKQMKEEVEAYERLRIGNRDKA